MLNNGNENANTTQFDKENLKLVFSISNDYKNEMSKSLKNNSEQIFKLLNFSLVFLGIYITIIIFACNQQQEGSLPIIWPSWPAITSVVFLTVALIRSLIELSPFPSSPIILPKNVYKLISKKQEDLLPKIIATYLDSVNKMWIISEKKNFSRFQIIILILISVINFLLFGTYCIFIDYDVCLNNLSIILSVGFLIFYLILIMINKRKIKALKEKLEKD